MVCVDAYKHKLDFRKSFEDNQIAELKLKYQGKKNAGASTLISRATAEDTIPDREEKRVSFMTPAEKKLYDQGYKIYRNTGYTKMVKKEGSDEWERVPVTTKVSRMSKVKDAYELASGGSRETTTRIERVYADHANALKALALEARKSAREEKDIEYDPSARKTFDKEVRQLKSELNRVEKNQPLERLAQRIANKSYKVKMAAAEKVLDAEHRSRLKSQELFRARELVGASRQVIDVTERQWAAIMAGAVSKTLLKRVLAAMEPEQVRMYATPRAFKGLSPARVSRARAMLANGATQADVADALNVSVSTLIRARDDA